MSSVKYKSFAFQPDINKQRIRTLLPYLFLILLVMVLPGCKAQQANLQKQEESQVFLLFQKTPCFGICPSYEATIYENGSITFVGWEHVPVKDTLQLKFTPQEIQSLRQEVEQLNYAAMQDSYLTQWSDMPSTLTTFYVKGKQVKRVKHQEAGPESLVQFQEHLHKQIMGLVEAEAKNRLPKE